MDEPVLFQFLPALKGRIPYVKLGDWPTPLEPMTLAGFPAAQVFVKREDASSRTYGGNKIRTLEVLLGHALLLGCRRVWSTGAYGSNHALATAMHAPALGLEPASALFPQPPVATAAENLAQLYSLNTRVHALSTVAAFPFRLLELMALARLRRDYVMLPGGAVTLGAMGHLGALFELLEQVRIGLAPMPRHLVVPCGSICTAAGLLAGIAAARALGLDFEVPRVHALRVTPWPVTSRGRVLGLARRALALVACRGGPVLRNARRLLASTLVMHGRYLGGGYGKPTASGESAIRQHAAGIAFPLETTYSAKAMAGLLDLLPQLEGPVVFWSTKSGAPLHKLDMSRVQAAPRHVLRWLAKALS